MIHTPIIAPSLLAGNHAHFAAGEKIISDHDLTWIHLDIMDGHFVPNLSFGPKVIKDLRPQSKLYFDTHLMLDNPHLYVKAFAEAGSQNITIHVEPEYPIEDTLLAIKAEGCQCGIALNPGTPAEAVLPFIASVDLVLIMTVQPGFGGQSFKSEMLDKIACIHSWRLERGLEFRLEVDGGINEATGRLCRLKGADTFVAGTAFFKAANKKVFCDAITT